jgi:hypothetical protein
VALNFAEIPVQGGGWFKPADCQGAVAILIEVNAFEAQRPTPNGPKDSVLADVSVFKTEADLQAGTPEVAKGQRIEQTILARDLKGLVGSATIVTVDQIPATKPGQRPAWVWRPISSAAHRKAVVDYATEREAKVQAAMSAAPSFDD